MTADPRSGMQSVNWIKQLFGTKSSGPKRDDPPAEAAVRPDPYRIGSVDDLWSHIAYVRAYAPNYWKEKDFLLPEEQMTLDRAFKLLRDGIEVAYPESTFSSKRALLNEALDRALEAYRDGDEVTGATILQDEFEDQIFKAFDGS